MKLPLVDQPHRYAGLFVFDFGEWAALGYTAEEVSMLLESEQYRDGKAYRIVRAAPDGTMELRGISAARFHAESGLFHWRATEAAARDDFGELLALADEDAPPCRMNVQLAAAPFVKSAGDRGPTPGWVTALIYPAEFDEDVGRWLLRHDYRGGDWVEGGTSAVTRYREWQTTVLDRRQLWNHQTAASRSAEEVYQSVRRAVQR